MKNEFNKDEKFQEKHVILPLVGTKDPPLNKDNSRTFELSSQPGTDNAATFKSSVRILQGDEDLRSQLIWVKDCKSMLAGLNVTTWQPAIKLIESVTSESCYGNFVMALNAAAQVAKNADIRQAIEDSDATAQATAEAQDLEHYYSFDRVKDAIPEVIRHNIPYKCLQKVKRHLRRNCRKPLDMKVRVYANHLQRINSEELPQIPPLDINNSLSLDEIVDILLFGTPKAWQREMDRQGFDPFEQPLFQVINFMERIEESEDPRTHDNQAKQQKKPAPKGGNKKSDGWKKVSSNDSDKPRFHCMLHGWNSTHDTEDCRVLQSQAKKLKSDSGNSYGHKGSSWNKGGNSNNPKAIKDGKEINAFIKKAIAKGVKREMHSLKRKASASASTSSDEDGEIHMIQKELDAVDIQLKGFNYSDMDKMQVEEEDCSV